MKEKKLRIHVVGTPRNASTDIIAMDPFAMVSYYLTTFLHREGYEVHYYGFKESTVECKKKWNCGDIKHHQKYNTVNYEKEHWTEHHEGNAIFFNKASNHILKNYIKGDIIICMWSPQVDNIVELYQAKGKDSPKIIIDGHLGHRVPSLKTQFHVWASESTRHWCYGMLDLKDYWHDATIFPMANVMENFEYSEKKEGYFLFMARKIEGKGLGIFLELARDFPEKRFIVAGQGDHPYTFPDNVKDVGLLNVKQRKEYLKNATAVVSASFYAEPFGLTVVEAGLSGTPVITTDHGGYTETVKHGYNGFRCSYYNDFVNAVKNIDTLKSADCKKSAMRFTAKELIKDWKTYLERINRDGWYSLDK